MAIERRVWPAPEEVVGASTGSARRPEAGPTDASEIFMSPTDRIAPLNLTSAQFRAMGHDLVNAIADLLDSFGERPVTTGESPAAIRALLGQGSLPEEGEDPAELVKRATELVLEHSLYNGHPRFLGYITGSPHPIGILGDMLAAAVNPNVAGWNLSPMASEMEVQTVRWIAELIGYPADCGGILVSGGAMANYVGLLAARHSKAPWPIRERGAASADHGRLRVYCSADTHTWIQKATDMFGLGTAAVRWIRTDPQGRMDMAALERRIEADRAAGDHPLMVVGTAGAVGTGAVDRLPVIANLCEDQGLWFHADGAYGALAAQAPGAPPDLEAICRADSVAVDPHKWLYAPLEAGCALVRDAEALRTTFSYLPPYYRFDEGDGEAPISFFEYGPQNSRGFRALKVWLGLKQVGRRAYLEMIGDDMALARHLYSVVDKTDELEALMHHLSITCFRYVPPGIDRSDPENRDRLNAINEAVLARMQSGGEAFVSNAVIDGVYALRGCVTNFRTTQADVEAIAELTVRLGREVAAGV
jgi:glutamate/tyrosine decarboxylase-like PLP-dependent enzyme